MCDTSNLNGFYEPKLIFTTNQTPFEKRLGIPVHSVVPSTYRRGNSTNGFTIKITRLLDQATVPQHYIEQSLKMGK